MKIYITSVGDHGVGEGDFRAETDMHDSIDDIESRRMVRESLRTAFAVMWPVEWHTIDVRFEDECADCRRAIGAGVTHAPGCPALEASVAP